MNDAVIICVHGNPLPKQSFVYTGNGGGYTKKSVKIWQDTVGWKAQEAMIDRAIFEGPVEVWITFWRKDATRVDCDNLAKCVTDALNGIVFSDDSQVIDLHTVGQVVAQRQRPEIGVVDVDGSLAALDAFHRGVPSQDSLCLVAVEDQR